MKALLHISALVLVLELGAFASGPAERAYFDGAPAAAAPSVNIPTVVPAMAPELALEIYQQRVAAQTRELGEYEDVTTIEAELPKTSQKGRFRLLRVFSAPKSLVFKAQDFVGDNFVKTQVIARLLQQEVDHVQKDDVGQTAITSANYKFSYKGTDQLAGETVHVFHVKPHKKRPGLFKGKVFIDARNGAILRAEGTAVKSPSIFIKKIDFVQDYAQVGSFSLISHIHSTAQTRIVGPAVVDIFHDGYQAHSLGEVQGKLHATAQNVSLGQ